VRDRRSLRFRVRLSFLAFLIPVLVPELHIVQAAWVTVNLQMESAFHIFQRTFLTLPSFLVSVRKLSEVPLTRISDFSSLTTVSDSQFSVSLLLSLVELRHDLLNLCVPTLMFTTVFKVAGWCFEAFLAAVCRALTSAGPR